MTSQQRKWPRDKGHSCAMPGTNDVPGLKVGSERQCHQCGRIWHIVDGGEGIGPFWQSKHEGPSHASSADETSKGPNK